MFKLKNKLFRDLKKQAEEDAKKEAEAAAAAAAKAPKGKAKKGGKVAESRTDLKSGGSKRSQNPD